MAQPVREDTTQDVILRVSQAKGTIIVEEHRTGGIISYREISPLAVSYTHLALVGLKARNVHAGDLKLFDLFQMTTPFFF